MSYSSSNAGDRLETERKHYLFLATVLAAIVVAMQRCMKEH
jgi:hypothetical protein